MIKVRIPTPLRPLTKGQGEVDAQAHITAALHGAPDSVRSSVTSLLTIAAPVAATRSQQVFVG